MIADPKYQKTFKLTGLGNSEINDVELPEPAFGLFSERYSFQLCPKSRFWRFGLRFGLSSDSVYHDATDRYKDERIKHIEFCVGDRGVDKAWKGDNNLYFQEYHIMKNTKGRGIHSWNTYSPLGEVFLEVERVTSNQVRVSCKSNGCAVYTTDFEIGEYNFFKVFAWADSCDFEIECTIQKSLWVRLNPIKALNGHVIDLHVQDLMIFFGLNNCGKTSVILGASHHFMNTSNFVMDYIGPSRFHTSANIDFERLEKIEHQEQMRKNRNTFTGDCENKGPDAMEEFSLQSEATREAIINWFNLNIEEFSIKQKVISKFNTTAEAKFGEFTPKEQGTGVRSILSIVTQLFNPEIKFLCIDEPELSLEPRTQKKLFELIKKAAHGEDGVPKKNILIATHSHIFLDKENLWNNYKVTKVEGQVHIDQIENENQLQGAVYDLLGNNPSDLFFPANIVVVEGRSDQLFLKGVLELLMKDKIIPEKRVVVHFVEGLDKAKLGVIAVNEMLKTQSYMPVYRNKICGLFDAPNNESSLTLIGKIRDYFKDDGSRFVTLAKDAIEYYYPLSLAIEVAEKSISGDEFERGTKLFLDQVNANKRTHEGNYFGIMIDKVSLSNRIVDELIKANDPTLVDAQITKLLRHAVELAF